MPMSRDRRTGRRAGRGTRSSDRVSVCHDVTWRCEGEGRWRWGMLIALSATGLALLVHPEDTPATGAHIHCSAEMRVCRWRGPARIVRTEALSDALHLVAAECADRGEEAA